MKKYILVSILLLLLNSCLDTSDDTILVINNSDKDICVYYGFGKKDRDTTIEYASCHGVVKANSKNEDVLRTRPSSGWPGRFNSYGFVVFFVCNANTYINNVPYYERESSILKKYIYNKSDMIANDWTIVYP